MKLRGIDFGNVLGASGVQGFFGEGYWFHRLPFAPDLSPLTFVAKTATWNAVVGNMPLTERYTPRGMFPECIKGKPFRGVMLNAVGLSNPGIQALLSRGEWQKRTQPFFLSVTSTARTPRARLDEYRMMQDAIGQRMSDFHTPFGLQINLSCPNTGHDPHELIGESMDVLWIMSSLGIPLVPKYSIASAPIKAIVELGGHPDCDGVCFSNTLPFGWKGVNWKRTWGSDTSPLAHLGGGGLSGRPLMKLVCEYINRLRGAGFTKPINGGGGIMSPRNVEWYHEVGASSIFLGTAVALGSFLPWKWRVNAIIKKANSLTWE